MRSPDNAPDGVGLPGPTQAPVSARGADAPLHTPGPWEIGDDGPILYEGMLRPVWNIYGGHGLTGRLVGSAEHFPEDEYPNANARLISAAPELLEALRGMVNWYGLRDGIYGSDRLLPAENQAPEVRKAIAVIAKATGAQP